MSPANTATANNGKKPLTYDHLRSQKKPQTRHVYICMDDDVALRYEEAKQEYENSKMAIQAYPESEEFKAEFKAAEKAFRDAEPAYKAAVVKFTFRSIGRKAYDSLISKNQPTAEQRAQVTKDGGDPEMLSWDPDTFPPALIAASIVEPELTVEDITDMFSSDQWSGPELVDIFEAALSANTMRRVVQQGNV